MSKNLAQLTEQIKANRAKIPVSTKARESAGTAETREIQKMAAVMREAFGIGSKHDPTGAPIANYYGNGGPFSYPYARPEIYSTVLQPTSLWGSLPMRQSRTQNEVREFLTSAAAASGTNPDNVCGVPPIPGALAVCRVWTPFGQYFAGTPVIDVTQVGMYDTYATQPREIQNFVDASGWFVPQPLATPGANLASEEAIQMFTLGTMIARQGATVEIDGDPSLLPAATELGWIKEPRGLSRIITDGYEDVSGTACPALDSIVVDWAAAVDAETSLAYDGSLPMLMHDIYFMLQSRARMVGMADTRWAITMPEQLFGRLSFVWACTYALGRCGTSTDTTATINREMATIEARYNEMRRGQYLLIAGVPVEVRFTTGYEVTEALEVQTGSIYFVPIRGNGRDLTYLEYFPMDNPDARAFNSFGNTTGRFYANNGLFAFAVRSNGFCDQWLVTYRPRLIVETPFLAARIDGITFSGFIGFRSPFPGNADYVGGGVATYTTPFPPA